MSTTPTLHMRYTTDLYRRDRIDAARWGLGIGAVVMTVVQGVLLASLSVGLIAGLTLLVMLWILSNSPRTIVPIWNVEPRVSTQPAPGCAWCDACEAIEGVDTHTRGREITILGKSFWRPEHTRYACEDCDATVTRFYETSDGTIEPTFPVGQRPDEEIDRDGETA